MNFLTNMRSLKGTGVGRKQLTAFTLLFQLQRSNHQRTENCGLRGKLGKMQTRSGKTGAGARTRTGKTPAGPPTSPKQGWTPHERLRDRWKMSLSADCGEFMQVASRECQPKILVKQREARQVCQLPQAYCECGNVWEQREA